MNEREQVLLNEALDRLRPWGLELMATGWRPELVVLAPEEIERIPGFKVALVVPLDPFGGTEVDTDGIG